LTISGSTKIDDKKSLTEFDFNH